MQKQWFTVIGIYPGTGQSFAEAYEASSAEEAIAFLPEGVEPFMVFEGQHWAVWATDGAA